MNDVWIVIKRSKNGVITDGYLGYYSDENHNDRRLWWYRNTKNAIKFAEFHKARGFLNKKVMYELKYCSKEHRKKWFYLVEKQDFNVF